MKILVTGSSGFIGQALLRKLENLNVLGIDLKDCDLAKDDPSKIIESFGPEVIIHLAAQIDVLKSFENPIYDSMVNSIGTISLTKSAISNNVKHFIYINSAGAIYSHTLNRATLETDPVNPQSPYGVSKLAGELNLQLLAENSDMQWSSLALSNVFGPFEPGRKGLVNICFENINKNVKTKIFGPRVTRDYVYLSDVIDAIIATIQNPLNQRVHIAGNKSISNIHVAESITKILNVKMADYFILLDRRINEQEFSQISNKLAFEKLGWKPKHSFEEGLLEIARNHV